MSSSVVYSSMRPQTTTTIAMFINDPNRQAWYSLFKYLDREKKGFLSTDAAVADINELFGHFNRVEFDGGDHVDAGTFIYAMNRMPNEHKKEAFLTWIKASLTEDGVLKPSAHPASKAYVPRPVISESTNTQYHQTGYSLKTIPTPQSEIVERKTLEVVHTNTLIKPEECKALNVEPSRRLFDLADSKKYGRIQKTTALQLLGRAMSAKLWNGDVKGYLIYDEFEKCLKQLEETSIPELIDNYLATAPQPPPLESQRDACFFYDATAATFGHPDTPKPTLIAAKGTPVKTITSGSPALKAKTTTSTTSYSSATTSSVLSSSEIDDLISGKVLTGDAKEWKKMFLYLDSDKYGTLRKSEVAGRLQDLLGTSSILDLASSDILMLDDFCRCMDRLETAKRLSALGWIRHSLNEDGTRQRALSMSKPLNFKSQ